MIPLLFGNFCWAGAMYTNGFFCSLFFNKNVIVFLIVLARTFVEKSYLLLRIKCPKSLQKLDFLRDIEMSGPLVLRE